MFILRDWHDMSKAVEIEPSRIQEWIDQQLAPEKLPKPGDEVRISYAASGDSFVLTMVWPDGQIDQHDFKVRRYRRGFLKGSEAAKYMAYPEEEVS